MRANLIVGTLFLALSASYLGPLAVEAPERVVYTVVEDRGLFTQLGSYVAGLDGTYGIAVENLDDGRSVLLNADRPFPAGSLYKLLVMYRVFQAIERGDLSPEDTLTILGADTVEEAPGGGFPPGTSMTVSEALEAMITYSNNAAAYALAREVGGWNRVITAADELGMSSTGFDEQFWSTPADMLRFFELLAGGSLVSPQASDAMLDLLLRQTINDRIPALLPPEALVAHKTGDLPGVRNDGGIVQGPGGRYILVLMSQGVDPREAIEVEAEMSRRIYERYGS